MRFTYVDGFFEQCTDRITDEFNYLESDFGRTFDSWATFKQEFDQLVRTQDQNTRYKVLFLSRHGQGNHNLLALTYGFHNIANDESATDPELTAFGVDQAKGNNTGWKNQLQKGIPLPSKWYVSPLTRAIDTMLITFDGITDFKRNAPLVIEGLREDLDPYYFNKRRPRSYLASRFPMVQFDPSFSEEDELWAHDYDESEAVHDVRTAKFLQWLFDHDWNDPQRDTYVSITTHVGTIESFLRVVSHRSYDVDTGGMIPVVIKATRA